MEKTQLNLSADTAALSPSGSASARLISVNLAIKELEILKRWIA
jgi:hypothetical protein